MIAFFDTETTGLPTKKDGDLTKEPHVLQLAVSLYNNARRPIFEISTLVKIPPEVTIDPKAFEAHGISTYTIEKYGVSKLQALQLARFAFERADVVVAHNLQFDEKLLNFEAARTSTHSLFTEKRTFCTMNASTEILQLPPTPAMLKWGFGPYKNPSLSEAYRYFFSEDFEGAHDALADTRACARVYFEMEDQGLL